MDSSIINHWGAIWLWLFSIVISESGWQPGLHDWFSDSESYLSVEEQGGFSYVHSICMIQIDNHPIIQHMPIVIMWHGLWYHFKKASDIFYCMVHSNLSVNMYLQRSFLCIIDSDDIRLNAVIARNKSIRLPVISVDTLHKLDSLMIYWLLACLRLLNWYATGIWHKTPWSVWYVPVMDRSVIRSSCII